MKGHLLSEKRGRRASLGRVRRQERRTATEFGTRTTPASGAGDLKGDSVNRDWHIENKRTDSRQYILRRREIVQGLAEATKAGREFAMQIDFDGLQLVVVTKDVAKVLGVGRLFDGG